MCMCQGCTPAASPLVSTRPFYRRHSFCPENRLICDIACRVNIYVFTYDIFLSDLFTLYGNTRSIHVPTNDPVSFIFMIIIPLYILTTFFTFILNWRITAFQCCVHFSCTSAWISCKYTHVSFLWGLHLTPLTQPTRSPRSRVLGSPWPRRPRAFCLHVAACPCQCCSASSLHPPAPAVYTHSFSVCVSVPAQHVDSSVPLSSIPV